MAIVHKAVSNYKKTLDEMRDKFKELDFDAMAKRLDLQIDDEALYLSMMGYDYRIERETGIVWRSTCGVVNEEAEFEDSMFLYDLLSFTTDPVIVAGNYVRLENLASVVTSDSEIGEGLVKQMAKLIDEDPDAFAVACGEFGGVEQGRGDMSYCLPICCGINIILSFWESDDEFDASLNIFWDSLLLNNIHYESSWYLSKFVLHTLKRKMDVC